MDLYRFINSIDIRDYHKKIGYKYNALEAAWIVSQSQGLTLDQRHEAWMWIVDNLPDMKVELGRENNRYYGKSLHKILVAYMKMQREFIAELKCDFAISENRLYVYKPCYRCYNGTSYDIGVKGFYSSWDSCLKAIAENEMHHHIYSVIVAQVDVDSSRSFYRGGGIEVAVDGTILDTMNGDRCCNAADEYLVDVPRMFSDFYLDFPVPFKRGDIVCLHEFPANNPQPVVLTDAGLSQATKGKKKTGLDSSDMIFCGYEMGRATDGYLGIINEVWWNYMDLEYYRGELKGHERALNAVSSWLKGEFGDDIALVLAAYHRIMLEEVLADTLPTLYTKEAMRKAGLPEDWETN